MEEKFFILVAFNEKINRKFQSLKKVSKFNININIIFIKVDKSH